MLDAREAGSIEGMVFNVQRYSLHDGPGIRTVVFLKGCSLECPWCANPESVHGFREVMFSPEKCIDCGICLSLARHGEVYKDDSGSIRIDRSRIRPSELRWAEECPTGALKVFGRRRTVTDVLDEVGKDAPFFARSGGGVTFSGGEPLLQSRFVVAAAQESHRRGWNTAVETCGNVPLSSITRVSDAIDVFICDLKILDSRDHQRVTGSPNDRVLSNIEWLAAHRPHTLFIRTPLIPGNTMSAEQISRNLDYLQGLGVEHYDVLPFHRLGYSKYVGLGREYEFADAESPSADVVSMVREEIARRHMSTSCPVPVESHDRTRASDR